MDKHIEKLIEDIFEIRTIHEYHFKQLYGLTFAFNEKLVLINDKISSAEIKPVGIIYEENGQYYLTPIDETVEIDEVVREFVLKNLKK